MREFLKKFDTYGERWLLLGFYMYIVMVIAIEVLRRFGLAYSSTWGEETARFAFIYLVWIGCASAVRERAHIRIDVITEILPPRGVALLYMFADLLTIVLAIGALYWTIAPVLMSIKFHSVTEGLRVTRAWFVIAVPFGFSLVILRTLQSVARDIADFRAGREPYRGERLFD